MKAWNALRANGVAVSIACLFVGIFLLQTTGPDSSLDERGNAYLASGFAARSVYFIAWAIAVLFAFRGGLDRRHNLTPFENVSPRSGLQIAWSRIRTPLSVGVVAYLVGAGSAVTYALSTGARTSPDWAGLVLGLISFVVLACASFAMGRIFGAWLGMGSALFLLIATLAAMSPDSKLRRLHINPVRFNTDPAWGMTSSGSALLALMGIAVIVSIFMVVEIVRRSHKSNRPQPLFVTGVSVACAALSAAMLLNGPAIAQPRPKPQPYCSETTPQVCAWPENVWMVDAAAEALAILGEQKEGSVWHTTRFVEQGLDFADGDIVFSRQGGANAKDLAGSFLTLGLLALDDCSTDGPPPLISKTLLHAYVNAKTGNPIQHSFKDKKYVTLVLDKVANHDPDWIVEHSRGARECRPISD